MAPLTASKVLMLVALCSVASLVDASGRCRPSPLKMKDRKRSEDVICTYTEKKTGKTIVVDAKSEDECEDHKPCCWLRGLCVSSDAKGTAEPTEVDEDPFDVPKKLDDADKARFFQFGPPIPPGCIPPPPFPHMCFPRRGEPFVLEPPVDIPYCVRIPCSEERRKQMLFETDIRACGSQPGCYFDKELFELRNGFGPPVLPGVPVCHLAIRNGVFQREAKKVVQALGFWNPYYTNCALKTFYIRESRAEPEGCLMLPALKLFKVRPKIAGWRGIISSHCRIINGCWLPGEGCFYPVNVDKIIVKSGQQFKYNRYEAVHGRPKCQHFDPRTPISFLKSYDQCLIAGCSVDANAAAVYYNHLFALGESMSVEEHWKYWFLVEMGEIGPFNLESIPWRYEDGPAEKYKDISDDGLFYKRRRTSKIKQCGVPFKAYGKRPCKPPHLPDLYEHRWCPYKPFDMPRFRPLKGSFVGCCDINPCYLPKYEIRHAHSGPSYYYSEWSFYGPCSETCGWGKHVRYRKCVGHNKKMCKDKIKEVRECKTADCGRWSRWSDWSPCKSKRDCGIETRKRKCEPVGANCDGEEEESRVCGPWWCN